MKIGIVLGHESENSKYPGLIRTCVDIPIDKEKDVNWEILGFGFVNDSFLCNDNFKTDVLK